MRKPVLILLIAGGMLLVPSPAVCGAAQPAAADGAGSPLFEFSPQWRNGSSKRSGDRDGDGQVDARDLINLLEGKGQSSPALLQIAVATVPAGTFEMGNSGSPRDVAASFSNEFPRHAVTIPHTLAVGVHEISNQIFLEALNGALASGILTNAAGGPYSGGDVYLNGRRLVVASNPFCDIGYDGSRFVLKDRGNRSLGSHPVCFVTWFGAITFCNWISAGEGLPPCYNLANGSLVNPSGGGYRLPSEAEWEYFCRGPVSHPDRYSPFSFGDDPSLNLLSCDSSPLLDAFMSWCGNESGWSEEVGSRLPNPFGLFDIHGNVWEWCQDVWHSSYEGAPINGGAWEVPDGPYRVVRGGSWTYQAARCRSAARDYNIPDKGDFFIGFRVVRVVPGG